MPARDAEFDRDGRPLHHDGRTVAAQCRQRFVDHRACSAFNQLTGIVQVNGTVNAPGDYLFGSGLLMGTGRINAPFLTNVLGNIAPGTAATIGTLTIGGNLVLGSGSTFVVDLAGAGSSDALAVVAIGDDADLHGVATLGGTVLFAPTTTVRNGDVYTILTAAGGFGGTSSHRAVRSARS